VLPSIKSFCLVLSLFIHVNVAGLLNDIHSVDFFKISILACFCAIHNHGLQTLLIFSAIVRHTSCPPVGFSILRAGLIKPVCLSGYNSPRSSVSHETHGTTLVNTNCSLGFPYHLIFLYRFLIGLRQ
jgi:hypothetical protein